MAEIKMSYIFVEKEMHESKNIEELLLEIVDSTVETRSELNISINGVDISYHIIQKKNSERCFFEMTSSERVSHSIPALQKLDRAIFTSKHQKYFHIIRDYDRISENFCKKLYPKFAEFERQIRSFVLFILTKAYGSEWRAETVTEEMLRAIQERAHGNVSLNETLENMDLNELETYLFEIRHVDYPAFIYEKLSEECLKNLEKDEICKIIEEMRPTSLWKRHFEQYGSQELWKKRITDIHGIRNKVAHQKTITMDEFKKANSILNGINRELKSAVEGIREENFTEYGVVDILGSFATMAVKLFIKSIEKSQVFIDVIIGFSAKIQKIQENMKEVFARENTEAWNSLLYASAGFEIGVEQSKIIEGLNAACLAFSKEAKERLDYSKLWLNDENLMASFVASQNELIKKQVSIGGREDGITEDNTNNDSGI